MTHKQQQQNKLFFIQIAHIWLLFAMMPMSGFSQSSLPDFPECNDSKAYEKHDYKTLLALSHSAKKTAQFCYLLAASHKAENEEQQTLVAQISTQKSNELYKQAKYRQANYYAGLASHLWTKLAKHSEQIISLINISDNYYYIGDIYSAIVYANRARNLSQKYLLTQLEYKSINALAWCYWKIDDFKKALKFINEGKKMIDEHKVSDNLINYYNAMGNLLDKQKKYPLAIKYNDSALTLAKKHHNDKMRALCISNKAFFMIKNEGNKDSILRMTKKAIAINRHMNDQEQLSSNLALLAKVYLHDKQYDKAIYWAKQGLNIAKKIDRKPNEIMDYLYLKEAYFYKNDFVNAYKYSEKHTALYKQLYGPVSIIKIFDIQQKNANAYHKSIIENLKKEKEIIEIKNTKNRHSLIYTTIILLLIILGIISYFVYIRNYSRRKNEAIQKKLQYNLIKMEMEALRAKMNPHFLFNSLNSINSFIAVSDSKSASKYLAKFAQLMRLILNHSKHKLIPLSDELKAIEYYVALEKVRLKEKFDYCLEIAPEINLNETYIPPAIIQPFIENAIWHGLSMLEEKGVLCIRIYRNDNRVVIEIDDNGIGRKAAKKNQNKTYQSMSSGIINKTIKAFKGDKDIAVKLNIVDKTDSSGNSSGTKVLISITNLKYFAN